jgi:lipoprotein-releasing system ATP-binding protein
VIENILFPKMVASSVITRADIDLAEDLLRRVRLGGIGGRDVTHLSGGERQRIAVIRAVINRPLVVIADEPTGSLDEKSADLTMEMIVDLCRSHGSALLLITHNRRFAGRMQTSYSLQRGELKKM